MSEQINKILERFKSKLSYRDKDTKALDISRAAAAGSLSTDDKEYAEWALISNDPVVIINYVRTFITTLSSKLASNPFRPNSDALKDVCEEMGLNEMLAEIYADTLSDGYAFLGLGIADGSPTAKIIDARYIMFNGNDPTLKDSTELVIFEILPRESDDNMISTFPSGYIEYDTESEKVRTSYYHLVNGIVHLDIYDEGIEEPTHYEIKNVSRIPVVRFYGEKFELNDKRYHYRGLYYQHSGVSKALALAATKIQTRIAASDDNNYIGVASAIENNKSSWQGSGMRIVDNRDGNNEEIKNPVTPIAHDNQFLIEALQTWKGVISDMLGPVVQSSSEAITREEVLARSEIRDAISNIYLTHIARSLAEVYHIIQQIQGEAQSRIVVQGGVVEATRRTKQTQELVMIYNLAKESGLNAQGFILEIVANSTLPLTMRQRIGSLLMADPYASPITKQLTMQIQQRDAMIQTLREQMTQLRIMASQRLERQSEWVASQERMKRAELQFKQWQQESKDTQEARMEYLRTLLQQGDAVAALAVLNAIQQTDAPVLAQPITQAVMNQESDNTKTSYTGDIQNVASNNSSLPGTPWNASTTQAGRPTNVQPAEPSIQQSQQAWQQPHLELLRRP